MVIMNEKELDIILIAVGSNLCITSTTFLSIGDNWSVLFPYAVGFLGLVPTGTNWKVLWLLPVFLKLP